MLCLLPYLYDDVEHCKYPATIKRIVNRLVELVSKTQSSVIKAILVETAINMIDNIDIYSDCNISMFDIIKLDSTYITIPAGTLKIRASTLVLLFRKMSRMYLNLSMLHRQLCLNTRQNY